MAVIIEPIIKNIRDTKVKIFLESKGIKESENDDRLELSAWLEHLLDSGRISEEEINDFFFEELMSGKRQLVRIYSLKSVRKMKRVQDWTDFVREYDCPDLSFNRIISTSLSDEDVKVCAINSKIFDGKIQKIELIFVYKIKLEKDNSISATYSYIPVVFDFTDRKLTIKVWNRDDVCEGYRPMEQLDWIFNRLQDLLDFEIMPASVKAQKVLYRMSKVLFDEFYGHLPSVTEVKNKKANIPVIVNSLLDGITLSNSIIKNGLRTMNDDVINVNDEIYKLVQQIALFDYLQDHTLQDLLQNTDKYISRVRFSDRDNLTASLTSEKGVRCIFDAKTFMCVRNSLDLVEQIVSIVVTFSQNSGKGLMSVKYDASDGRFLTIHVLNSRYYTNDDYKKIWELYNTYESEYISEAEQLPVQFDVEAM